MVSLERTAINNEAEAVKSCHPLLLTFLVTTTIGVFDEVLQRFLPERVFDYYDIVFNILAIAIALVSILLFHFVRKRFLKKTEGNEV